MAFLRTNERRASNLAQISGSNISLQPTDNLIAYDIIHGRKFTAYKVLL